LVVKPVLADGSRIEVDRHAADVARR
jgi:hypothetical protein